MSNFSNRYRRWIKCYDLKLRTSPPEASEVEIKMSDLIKPLQKCIRDEEAFYLVNNESAAYRILELHHNELFNSLVFLLQYTDMNAADPAYSHLKTGKIRTEPKLDGEGIAVSAHMIVLIKEPTIGSNSYVTLIEEMPGLNRTGIQRFLNHIFEKISNGQFYYENQKKQRKDCRPIADLQGHPSDSLRDALKTGTLKEIKLIRRKPGVSIIDEKVLATEEEVVETRIRIDKESLIEHGLNFLDKQLGRARKDEFNEVRVRYHDPRTSRQENVVFEDLQAQDANDVLFVRREVVKVDRPLQHCEAHIRCDIIERMFSLFPKTNLS